MAHATAPDPAGAVSSTCTHLALPPADSRDHASRVPTIGERTCARGRVTSETSQATEGPEEDVGLSAP